MIVVAMNKLIFTFKNQAVLHMKSSTWCQLLVRQPPEGAQKLRVSCSKWHRAASNCSVTYAKVRHVRSKKFGKFGKVAKKKKNDDMVILHTTSTTDIIMIPCGCHTFAALLNYLQAFLSLAKAPSIPACSATFNAALKSFGLSDLGGMTSTLSRFLSSAFWSFVNIFLHWWI